MTSDPVTSYGEPDYMTLTKTLTTSLSKIALPALVAAIILLHLYLFYIG
jgi:hypothetical protein